MAAVEKFKAPELNPAEAGAHGTTVSLFRSFILRILLTPNIYRFLHLYKKSLKKKKWTMLMLRRRTLILS
jgi:hypothetical protein